MIGGRDLKRASRGGRKSQVVGVITQEIGQKNGKKEQKDVKRRQLFSCQRGRADVPVAPHALAPLYIRELVLHLPPSFSNTVISPQKHSTVSHNSIITPQQAINYTAISNPSPAVWNVCLALGLFMIDHTLNISM